MSRLAVIPKDFYRGSTDKEYGFPIRGSNDNAGAFPLTACGNDKPNIIELFVTTGDWHKTFISNGPE
jgi:hypothetical protein